MTELTVKLDFTCPSCHQPVGVTVRCAGDLSGRPDQILASVVVPCPCCEHVTKLTFRPDGTVHAVTPHLPARLPEPSPN